MSTSLSRSSPEAQGVSSSALCELIDSLNEKIHDMHSLMLLRNGHVIAEGWWEPYGPKHAHQLFSLSKSFTSSAMGMLVAEGRLSLRDKVISFFLDDLPAQMNPHLAAMTVHDLLSMNTGHETEPMLHGDENWARVFLAHPPTCAPGTRFLYNTPATYMCSAILSKITGQKLIDYLRPRLFEPLGIQNPTWEECPRGNNTGGYGLNITTEDIAKFGQLYLQKGLWNGRALLPADYIEEATRKQVRNDLTPINQNIDWQQGYGYQFWRCRHNAYRGDGAFGQYCIVLPEKNLVVAITSGVQDMQAVLNVLWDKLLPALGDGGLPANSAAQETLSKRLRNLSIPTLSGHSDSSTAQRITGKTYKLDTNEKGISNLAVKFGPDADELTLTDSRGSQTLVMGHGRWALNGDLMQSRMRLGGPLTPVASSGAWMDEHTYTFRAFFRATPFSWLGTLRFDNDTVACDVRAYIHFEIMPAEIASLRGKLQGG